MFLCVLRWGDSFVTPPSLFFLFFFFSFFLDFRSYSTEFRSRFFFFCFSLLSPDLVPWIPRVLRIHKTLRFPLGLYVIMVRFRHLRYCIVLYCIVRSSVQESSFPSFLLRFSFISFLLPYLHSRYVGTYMCCTFHTLTITITTTLVGIHHYHP